MERNYSSALPSDQPAAQKVRFRVLVNGFSEGRSFASLREAQGVIAAFGADEQVEIYDAFRKQYVWTRQGQWQ